MKHITTQENVQRRATKLITGFKDLQYKKNADYTSEEISLYIDAHMYGRDQWERARTCMK